MNIPIFEHLFRKGLINQETLNSIKDHDKDAPVSVHWDLLTILYGGILLFTTGLGVIIYKNLDSIGHLAITLFVTIATLTCFLCCFVNARPFTFRKTESPNIWFDYILLIGCLLMLILVGYLQYTYEIFGRRYGMATFIPMLILFASAYYFDHIGVLSLAIINLAAWVGLTVTPLHLIDKNDFSSAAIIYSGLLLGIFLLAIAIISELRSIKAHFSFTYRNFGTHLLLVSLLAATIHFTSHYYLWFIIMSATSFFLLSSALKHNSFYFFVTATLYFYIGISYIVIKLFLTIDTYNNLPVYLSLIYLVISGIGLITLLMRFHKIIRQHVSI
jgi:hypothetical protein